MNAGAVVAPVVAEIVLHRRGKRLPSNGETHGASRRMRLILHAALLLSSNVAFSQEQDRVPKELFGVKLDGIYQLKEGDTNTLPVAKVRGIIRSPPRVQIYFEPLDKDPMFPYVEYPERSSEYLMTSYRLQLLAVITDDVDTREELEAVTEFRVVLIEWSSEGDGGKRDSDSYAWAVDLCESTADNIGLQPEDVRDSPQDNWHICTFAGPEGEIEVSRGPLEGFPIVGPERELEIASQFGKAISLENRNALAEMLMLHFE